MKNATQKRPACSNKQALADAERFEARYVFDRNASSEEKTIALVPLVFLIYFLIWTFD